MPDNAARETKADHIGIESPLASSASTRISLEAIRNKEAGLNEHRSKLLSRVSDRECWGTFPVNSIEIKDLAYLSAATGDEFAFLRSKHSDILYHGTPYRCKIEEDDDLMILLNSHKAELVAHTHPDYEAIIPSAADRNFIRSYGQKKSKIISAYTGQIIEFTSDMFEV